MTQETKTRSEQYMDAVNRARNALGTDDLDMVLSCVNAALWVTEDLERQAIEVNLRSIP